MAECVQRWNTARVQDRHAKEKAQAGMACKLTGEACTRCVKVLCLRAGFLQSVLTPLRAARGAVCLQDQVSSSNPYPTLGDIFKHGQVVTARIHSTDIGERKQAQEGAKRK
jgi:hypothetical protein